jgi:monoamine oxidase
MKTTDILVIGAGAAGLMAACKLSQKGKKVTVLEARDRTGGRIHTLKDRDFFKQAELGAEFIHGDLPVTLALLKEAGIAYEPADGEMLRYTNGQFVENESFIEHWSLLTEKLQTLKEDTSIGLFLEREFAGDEYKSTRHSVTRFVSGYDTADIYRASAFALRREWMNEDEGAQHRVVEGYGSVTEYLADKIKAAGGAIYLNSMAKTVHWQQDDVRVATAEGEVYTANKLVIALPLGVLQAKQHERGALNFEPPIKEHIEALRQMGFGAIIKFLLEFDTAFWEQDDVKDMIGRDMKEMAFVISDEEIPTWWTQHPQSSTLLTGWLGGPPAEVKKHISEDDLLQQALQSLCNIFKLSVEDLKTKLIAWNVVNWTMEPFTRGSYSYDTTETPKARKLLMEPVNDTLFFAGEYLYDGPAMGTVEAALSSGVDVAEKI